MFYFGPQNKYYNFITIQVLKRDSIPADQGLNHMLYQLGFAGSVWKY